MESKKDLRRRYREDIEVVKKALRLWDPIGVIPDLVARGLPPSEYDSYAPQVLGMLQRGCSTEEIGQYFTHTQEEMMGLATTPLSVANDLKVAADLVAWWKDHK